MRCGDIEPGTYYLTTGGSILETLTVDRHLVTYRYHRIKHRGNAEKYLGKTLRTGKILLARRIAREVEPTPDEMTEWRAA